MRLFSITILSCCILSLHAGGYDHYSKRLFSPPDTLPPPPPPNANPITGPTSACVGDISEYYVDIPVSCICQWAIDGIIQPDTISPLTITWTQSGMQTVSVVFLCADGQMSDPQTLDVYVPGSPPAPVQGPGESCEGNTEIYTTSVGPGESCEWRVDGVLEPSATTTLEVTWTERGGHLVEVRAVSYCGTGNPTFKNVQVLYQPVVFLGNDTTILQGQILVLDAGNPGSDYLWSTGETTQTKTVNATGTYSVNVSNLCGADADTIEVTVLVGTAEYGNPGDCFRLVIQDRKISFPEMPEDFFSIQVINLAGMICYDGPPVYETAVDHTGIYLILVISEKTTCYKKVFIP